jgi:hypothetical protein
MKKNTRKNSKKNKSKRNVGGDIFSNENSSIMLGIPVNDATAIQITKYSGQNKDDSYINEFLRKQNTPIRIQRIDGSGLRILGYNIENVSHIHGPLHTVSKLLSELDEKHSRFREDIKKLHPEVDKITLSLYEVEDGEIDVNIDDLEPYLFEIKSL